MDYTTQNKPKMTIQINIPFGLEIKPCFTGLGLLTTQSYKKWDVISKSHYILLPDMNIDIDLHTGSGTFLLNSLVHGIKKIDRKRLLFVIESFINHSCSPNVMIEAEESNDKNSYSLVAVKDIKIGEELKIDYTIHEYDSRDKNIDKCLCGSDQCIKKVYGYKYLTNTQKRQRIPDYEVILQWVKDPEKSNEVVIFDDNPYIPETLEFKYLPNKKNIRNSIDYHALVANKNFRSEEIIFTTDSQVYDPGVNIIMCVKGKIFWINNKMHVWQESKAEIEYLGICTFLHNGDVEPNTDLVYNEDKDNYSLVALQNIKAGEILVANLFDY